MNGRAWVAALCGGALLLSAGRASAFCRTTTCDPNNPKQKCVIDDDTCVVTGLPLAWRSSCVGVAIQEMGSPEHGFSYDTVASVVESAFAAWTNASCAGERPSIEVQVMGPVECGVSEYNSDAGNANIVLFREGEWPYAGAQNALGLTTTRFDTKTGELWDADIELNGSDARFSIGDPIKGDDLLSVLTHEAGHFLGLSHSSSSSATMKPVYDAARDGASFRSLSPDDVAGICEAYPPDRAAPTSSCENRHGFSGECGDDQPKQRSSKGCSAVAHAPRWASGSSLLAALMLVATRRARRFKASGAGERRSRSPLPRA